MPTLLQSLKRRTFWIVARACFALYHRFPLFGSLPASIAVIHRDGRFLVIRRNDGRGISLPGGIASWRETEKATLRREVLEETGLTVTSEELLLRYHSDAEILCDISVFTVEVTGELKDSWEGSPCWMTVAELEPLLLKSQHPVLELLKKIAAERHPVGKSGL